jgi:DNA-binding NarL/FixJ family response regulator
MLADDHQVFCEGLAAMISAAGIEVVGLTGDRDELFELVVQTPPDVAVVDVSMPGISIRQLLSMLRQRQIPTQVLILTGDADPQLAEEMLQAGARGLMLKEHAFEAILLAIRSVAEGQSYVSPQLAGTMLRRRDGPVSSETWTDRQLEILRLVAAGDTSQRIARKLGIHIKTVENHRQRIRQKLGVHSVAEMVRVAKERGLV